MIIPTKPDNLTGTGIVVPPSGGTLTGQTPLAYRIAAGIVLLTVALQLGATLPRGLFSGVLLFRLTVDFALALALFQLWPGARAWMLIRVGLGILFMPICVSQSYGMNLMTLFGVIFPTLGYSISILLLLNGRSTTRRLVAALAIYALLCLVPFGYDYFLLARYLLLG